MRLHLLKWDVRPVRQCTTWWSWCLLRCVVSHPILSEIRESKKREEVKTPANRSQQTNGFQSHLMCQNQISSKSHILRICEEHITVFFRIKKTIQKWPKGKNARFRTSQHSEKKEMPLSIPSGSMHHQHWRQQLPSRPTSFGTHLPGTTKTSQIQACQETWFGGCKRSKPNCWVQQCHCFVRKYVPKEIPQAIWLSFRTPPPISSIGTPSQWPQSSLPITGCVLVTHIFCRYTKRWKNTNKKYGKNTRYPKKSKPTATCLVRWSWVSSRENPPNAMVALSIVLRYPSGSLSCSKLTSLTFHQWCDLLESLPEDGKKSWFSMEHIQEFEPQQKKTACSSWICHQSMMETHQLKLCFPWHDSEVSTQNIEVFTTVTGENSASFPEF